MMNDMRRMFMMDDFFPFRTPITMMENTMETWKPSADIVANKDNYTIHAELPGVPKESVKVTIDKNMLTLSGERKSEINEDDKDKQYHRRERMYGKFMRTFELPENVDPNQIKANFKDGILEISVPRTEVEEAKAIEIPIQEQKMNA